MEEQGQVEELQKSLQEQGSQADDVSYTQCIIYCVFVHITDTVKKMKFLSYHSC